jgi:selenide,water dikinase
VINPQRVLKNVGAHPGDRLILTKRLGTGIIGTALKKNRASQASVDAAIQSMCALNRVASEIALQFEIHAATDVTGFGLLGHAREMAAGSQVSLILDSAQVEFLPDVLDYSREAFIPAGLKRNIEFIGSCVEFASCVPEEVQNLLYDPQTSGGLLLAVSPQDAAKLLAALRQQAIPARQIGEAAVKTQPLIQVR